MAQIVTPRTRPQFATVRYRVMEALPRTDEPTGQVVLRAIPPIRSQARMLESQPIPPAGAFPRRTFWWPRAAACVKKRI